MKHSIDIIPAPNLKVLDCRFPQLPFLQPNTIVKLTQNDSHMYAVYEPPTEPLPQAQICSPLCQLTNFTQGRAYIEPVLHAAACRRLSIYVSDLDWQLINNQALRLEEEFLNQIKLVWPGARLPLFYDRSNWVALRVECEHLGVLGEGSELEVLVEKAEQQQQKQQEDEIEASIQVASLDLLDFGNINRVRLPQGHVFLTRNKINSGSKADGEHQQVQPDGSEQYQIKLKCKTVAVSAAPQFPCHTSQKSIKQQIQIIKRSQLKLEAPSPPEHAQHIEILVQVDNYAEQSLQNSRMRQESLGSRIILNKSMIQHWCIDADQPARILRTKRNDDHSGNSVRLDYFLKPNNKFRIALVLFQRDELTVEQIKKVFVQQLVQKLSNFNQGNKNSITIYSRIIFVITNVQNTADSSSEYQLNASLQAEKSHPAYVSIFQGSNEAADPLTIVNSAGKDKEQGAKADRIQQALQAMVDVSNLYYCDVGQMGQKGSLRAKNLKDMHRLFRTKKSDSAESRADPTSQFITLFQICYQQQIDQLLGLMRRHSPSDPQYPILVTSFSNNGKSALHSILHLRNMPALYIDMNQMDDISINVGDLSNYLELVFQLSKQPYIFLDNLDSVCYRIEAGDLHRRQEKIAAKIVVRMLLRLSKCYGKLCIMTAKNEGNIDEELTHYELIKLKNPAREVRIKIARHYYGTVPSGLNAQQTENKINQIVQNSESMSFGQFSKYLISGYRDCDRTDSNKKQGLNALAGIKQAKKLIQTVIERPLRYNFVYRKLPIKLSRGILLYGGSGTGKTAIGESVAQEYKMKYFSIKGSDILSKYIGGSEAAVRDIFEKAMSVSPSIVFFDEFESIVPRRNSSNTGVTDRVVNQFLCYLDGVASVEGVYIIAASSRPELIDPALLRPGRIDTHIFLDYPTDQQRRELFQLYSNSIIFETPMEKLLELTAGFSYSDLVGLIKQLRIKKSSVAIKKFLSIDNQGQSAERPNVQDFKTIGQDFLQEIIKGYRTSINQQQQTRQKQKYLAFKRGDAPDISKQKLIHH